MIDVLDQDGNVIKTISREEAERDNHLTENVLVFVFDTSGNVWAQLRPMTKSHFPGRWDISACGGVVSGESPAEAAGREALEETGLQLDLRFVETFLNVFPGDNGEERNRLSHLYIGISDEAPTANDEVDEFKAWQPDGLFADIAANPDKYIPSFEIELAKALTAYTAQTNQA